MLNKFLFALVLGILAAGIPLDAQQAQPARIKGQIRAVHVVGHVTATPNAGGPAIVLHEGDSVSDATTVTTDGSASVILSFSNGASVNVAGDSVLNIETFEQDPFSEAIKVSDLKAEPGTSITKLSLTRGELVGKVVHLNVDKGSEFTVQTPVGAAGIRGTTFRIVFRPAPNGKAFFVVTTAEGQVVFKGTTSSVNIPAGKTVVATVDYTPPASGTSGTGSGGTTGSSGTGSSGTGSTGTGSSGTGSTTPTITVTLQTSDISATEQAQITTASQDIVSSITTTSYQAPSGNTGNGNSNGSNSSTNNNSNNSNSNNSNTNSAPNSPQTNFDNTPPASTPQQQQTTNGAGNG